MKIWFMFDNHTFTKVHATAKRDLVREVTKLFEQDGCGMLCVKDESDASINSLVLHGHLLGTRKWGVTYAEVEKWADEVIAERSFRTLMV